MKLDGRHMTAALALLAGSIVYNVWTFAKPRGGVVVPVHAVAARSESPEGVETAGAGAAADAPARREAPDVALDREPQWIGNPFRVHTPAPEPPVPAATPPPAPAEAEPVVNAVLYSAQRKLAMVNGRMVRVGDRIGGWTVAEILPNAVVLNTPSGGTRKVSRRMPALDRGRRD